MFNLQDIPAVSPALDHYTHGALLGEVWTRPDLSPRDRSIVTLAALIARNQSLAMPYYLNVALDNGVDASEISEIIAVVFAELLVNRAKLLLQVELALILEQRSANVVIDFSFETQQLALAAERVCQRLEKILELSRFEQLLSELELDSQMRRDAPCLTLFRLCALNESDDLRRNAPVKRDIFLEQREHAISERTGFDFRYGIDPLKWLCHGAHEWSARHVAGNSRARKTFDEHSGAPVGKSCDLQHSAKYANAMKVGCSGFLSLTFFLRDKQNQLVRLGSGFNRRERWLSADEQGNDDVRKNDDFAKRQNRNAGKSLHGFTVACEFVSQCVLLEMR